MKSLDAIVEELVRDMKDGLLPEILAEWYDIVLSRARELAPEHLRDKIDVEQDKILPMRFNLKISRRAITFVIMAIDQSAPDMPYTTRLYFEKVKEVIFDEYNKTMKEFEN